MTTESSANSADFSARSAKIAVIAVFSLAALFSLFVLFKPEPRIVATNSVGVPFWAVESFEPTDGELCATQQYIPAGVGAVRLYIGTHNKPGPKTSVRVLAEDGKQIARGTLTGFADSEYTSIPLSPAIDNTVSGAKMCLSVEGGKLAFGGTLGTDSDAGLELDGKEIGMDINISYMSAERKTLFSQLPTIFARAALFRPGWQGSWVFYLLFVLCPLVALGAAVALVRGIRSPDRYSTRKWALAITLLVGFNALVWSLVTPIFMAPDEVGHYAYTETIAELGKTPSRDPGKGGASYGKQEELAVRYVAVNIVLNENAKLPWSRTTYEQWKQQDAALDLSEPQGGGWTSIVAYSPIYYGGSVVPYRLAGGADVFGKAWTMRLWSVLLTALAGLFCFLFAREVMPAVRWAGPVAGLIAAFSPMFVHIGGTINNDSMLFAFAAALMYLLARAVRRGAGPKLGAAIGAVLAIGILAKPTMLGFVPAAGLGLGIGLWRGWRGGEPVMRQWVLAPASAIAVAVAVLAAYYIPASSGDSAASAANLASADTFSWPEFAAFIWQWYFPELPGMTGLAQTAGIPAVRVFVRGFFADFNSLDTHFAEAWYGVMTAFLLVLFGGLVAWGVRQRERWRDWWAPVAICLVAVLGTLFLVHFRSYLQILYDGGPFAQGRYLLPLVPIFAVAVIAGAQGFKRWAPAVAASVVAMLIVLNNFGMMLSMLRFYI